MIKRIQNISTHRLFLNISIILISLLGTIIVLYSTVWGAALSDDSYYYIRPARILLAGQGFDFSAHFPPALPLVLSFIGLFTVDPLISIRWFNAILFAINISLVAKIVYTLTKSYIFSMLGALFTLVSSTLIMIHASAISEALFMFFTLLGILVYTTEYGKQKRLVPLLMGLFFGLAAGTRYIGISLLLAGAIFWLVESGAKFPTRLRNALVFSVVGIIPLLLWAIHNQIVFGQPTTRVFGLHLMPNSMWINMLNTILLWFIPGRFVHGKELIWLGLVILIVAIWLIFSFIYNQKTNNCASKLDDFWNPIKLISLIAIIYVIILVVSRSFFDIRIPVDERLLSPILVMALLLLLAYFSRLRNYWRWLEYGIIVGVSLIFLVTNFTRSIQMVQSYHVDGRGYMSARDHISETYAYLRNRPDIPIYSNASVGIYFWLGRETDSIPASEGVSAMKAEMKERGALLVIFDSIPVELYGTTIDELTAGLVEEIRLSEATIYHSP